MLYNTTVYYYEHYHNLEEVSKLRWCVVVAGYDYR